MTLATGASPIQSYALIIISWDGTNFTFKYGTLAAVTIPKFDSTAVVTAPGSLGQFMWYGTGITTSDPRYGRIFVFRDAFFKAG